VLHVLVAVLLITSISLTISAIMTTGWQTFTDGGTNEIHQHGLWFDYTYAKQHVAGKTDFEWHWKYKFGQSVHGDEGHQWEPYQYNTLILLAVSVLLGFVALILSYLAPFFVPVAIIFIVISVFPVVLTTIGVIVFFTTAALPDHNHVYLDGGRRIQLDISYSFYLAVVAAAGFALTLLAAIGAGVIDILMTKRGERVSLRDTYFRVSTKSSSSRQQHTNTSV